MELHHPRRGFEETIIALLLGLMTLVTFINVVARYVFNASLIWGQELTLILFAWLVLFGMAYGVRVGAHLGVDALINVVNPGLRRVFGLLAAFFCLAYALLILKGAWDYWAPFAGLSPTEGHWLPTGFKSVRSQAWYETEQIPMVGMFRFLEGMINDGDSYEKLPRVIPYLILPVGAVLFLFRLVQATLRILSGETDRFIASHEAEEAVQTLAAQHEVSK